MPLESGRLVLCCDECDAVFAAPADVMAGRCEHPGLAPDGATWTVFGERMLRDRADDEDLERVGWLHYDWKRRPA